MFKWQNYIVIENNLVCIQHNFATSHFVHNWLKHEVLQTNRYWIVVHTLKKYYAYYNLRLHFMGKLRNKRIFWNFWKLRMGASFCQVGIKNYFMTDQFNYFIVIIINHGSISCINVFSKWIKNFFLKLNIDMYWCRVAENKDLPENRYLAFFF